MRKKEHKKNEKHKYHQNKNEKPTKINKNINLIFHIFSSLWHMLRKPFRIKQTQKKTDIHMYVCICESKTKKRKKEQQQ